MPKTKHPLLVYVEYPVRAPKQYVSPGTLLKWQSGDSFDFSLMTCSFLLGAGYDAYCVYGYAPKFVCVRDQSRLECPAIHAKAAAEAAAAAAAASSKKAQKKNKYRFKRPKIGHSNFLQTQAQKEKEREQAKIDAELKLLEEDPVPEPADPLEHQRVHCWILITPKKRTDVDGFTFIEATTGRFYTAKDCPYLSVECIWNHENYWVNLQDQTKPMSDMDWDMSNENKWASVFDTTEDKAEHKMNMEETQDLEMADEDQLDDGEPKQEQITEEKLDLPPSWVELIEIPQSVFNQQFGEKRQEKVVLYSKAKHEMFPQHLHKEGLTSRVTVYEDEDYTIPIEVREELYARDDKLVRRLRYPLEGRCVEDFDPGRPRKLIKLEQIMGKSHKMVFNSFARLDGLVERSEQFGKEMVEKFEGRDDRLIYRQVTVMSEESSESSQTFTLPGGTVGEFLVDKMVQKFSKDPAVQAEKQVQKRVFHMFPKENQRIIEYMHYGENRILQQSNVYNKSQLSAAAVGMGSAQPATDSLFGKSGEDAFAANGPSKDFTKVLKIERECYNAVRDAKKETERILKARQEEESNILLVKNVFETIRDKDHESDKQTIKDDDEEVSEKSDYLTPFMRPGRGSGPLDKDEAKKVNDACLNALKMRLVERANIIQRRIDQKYEDLTKRQAAFQRSRDAREGMDATYEEFCQTTMFKIQILEHRFRKHDETAMEKYEELINRLKADPRLAAMYK